MNDEHWDLVLRKTAKLRELRRAKARVRRLERELRGEPVPPDEAPYVPNFLRPATGPGQAHGRVVGRFGLRLHGAEASLPPPPSRDREYEPIAPAARFSRSGAG